VDVGGNRFLSQGEFFARVYNDFDDPNYLPDTPTDLFSLADGDSNFNDPILWNGIPQLGNLTVNFYDDTANLWNGDALPAVLKLGEFTRTYGQVFLSTQGIGTTLVTFTINSLSLIPEPPSAVLSSIAVVASLTSCRRRKCSMV
jgi:hypothetical protein